MHCSSLEWQSNNLDFSPSERGSHWRTKSKVNFIWYDVILMACLWVPVVIYKEMKRLVSHRVERRSLFLGIFSQMYHLLKVDISIKERRAVNENTQMAGLR